MRCLRCGRAIKVAAAVGPDCAKLAEVEAAAFCRKLFGQTPKQFADCCATDFAGDEGLTLDEYLAEYGCLLDIDGWFIEAMTQHGLWS